MKKKFVDEDLKYLNGRINRVFKEVRELKDLVFKWRIEDYKKEEDLK